jgi:hypothetical protein
MGQGAQSWRTGFLTFPLVHAGTGVIYSEETTMATCTSDDAWGRAVDRGAFLQEPYYVPLTAGPAWSEWCTKIDNTMQSVFLRHMTAQQGVAQATQAVQSVLNQFWAS